MNIEQKLVEKVVELNFQEGERSKKYLKSLKKNIKDLIKNEKNFIHYEFENGVFNKIILASHENSPFLLDRIECHCFYICDELATKKNIRDVIKNLRMYFLPLKNKIALNINSVTQRKTEKILKSLGFEFGGAMLQGSPIESLRSISLSNKDHSNLKIRNMNFNLDIDKVLKLEMSAHRAEPTSVVTRLPKKHWSFFRDLLKELADARSAFVLLKGEKIIGFSAHFKRADLNRNSMITTISIDPKFKGLGISKLLYVTILEDMKKKKVSRYYGFSRTKQVIELAKKMNRKNIRTLYVLDKSKEV